jgi:hypothetical protein
MSATKSELIDAQMLARFADLKPEEVDEFRHSVAPNFVPEQWWDFDGRRIEGWKIWQEMQELVRDTWDAGFPTNYTLSVLLNHFSTATQTEPESLLASTDIFRALPYQSAVMFMFNQSWRARSCNRPECRKRFVAQSPNDQFCSDACRIEFRRRYKADYIREKRRHSRSKRGK